jgi:beta-phosphoglucomutase
MGQWQIEQIGSLSDSMIRGFIFDLDGVLTDTSEFHYLGWQRLADEEGLSFSREINETLRGIPRRASLMLILNGHTYPEEKFQEMMERKNNYYLELVRGITPKDLLPGARELLEEIHAAGMQSALGSASKNAREVIQRLGIESLLDAVADGSSVEHQKPAPDLFLHAAAQLELPPEECVVVEDAAAGIEAAQAGGFHSLGLGPIERVGNANIVFESLKGAKLGDILKLLGDDREDDINS